MVSNKNFFFSSDLPTKVTGIKIEERKSHLTRITWNKSFVICTPKYQFRLLFKNESTPLFEYATSNSFFICDSRCAKATELDILAIVDGMEWNLTKFNLSKIDEGEFLQKIFLSSCSFYFMVQLVFFRKNEKECEL